MNAFLRMTGKKVLEGVAVALAVFSVSFVSGYGTEKGKLKAREQHYDCLKF